MPQVKVKTELPKDQSSIKVDKEVTLSDRVVNLLGFKTNKGHLVEAGEVESVIEVDGERAVVGNEEVS
jgi:hypothetical protein